MVVDINAIRPDKGGNPEKYKASEVSRGRSGQRVDDLIALDHEYRSANYQQELLQRELNATSKEISELCKKDKGADVSALKAKASQINLDLAKAVAHAKDLLGQRDSLLHTIGNLVDPDVPLSLSEADNKVLRTYEAPKLITGKFPVLAHPVIMAKLGILNAQQGAAVCGHRGYYLLGDGVLLCRALQNYAIDFLTKRGYEAVQPPYFLRRDIMGKVSELKDFEETLYRIPSGEADKPEDLYLIATSEQSIAALHMNEFLDPKRLPIRYAGTSPCFRKEAGAHGKDIQGIFRVHQFEKIEQFVLTSPQDSMEEHERMIALSEEFYQALGLSYRIVSIVSGALNDAASKKYDLEAYFPAAQQYRELVSCSNCGDFQARDVETRYGRKKMAEKEKAYIHTLNATLVAAQRTLCCVLENYQTEDGVVVPRVLAPYLGGKTFLPYAQSLLGHDQGAESP